MSVRGLRGACLIPGLAAVAFVFAAGEARAQFNVQWAGFDNESTRRLIATSALGLTDPEEKDYAWGDVDNDGDLDLVVVRKQPFTSPGGKPNVFFLNEDGALVNRTTELASDSDAPGGDQGFLTSTNDRDVVLADFNNDGYLDIATAVTISDGLPKHISHPRIYMNKGAPQGTWLGFKFEWNRSPQLYVLNANGTPNMNAPNPGRFCSIAAGDVDQDGDVDLFLGDYDSSGAGGSGEPGGIDINDRLWINDGTGTFSDSYQTRLASNMLLSAFSAAAAIADMNGDGRNDIVKDTALNAPQYVGIAYNTTPDVDFEVFDSPHTFAPYFVSVGDLNRDNKLDIVVTDDGDDRYRLNTGNDGLGRVIFNPSAFTFTFPSGAGYSDDGFGSQSIVANLDNDEWNDVLISDVDVDIGGCDRRLHVYHNLGGTIGGNVTLREEAQQAGSNSGWKGAVGLMVADLKGTHNVAPFDIDMDGDLDLVVGRCNGTGVYMNNKNPCPIVRFGTTLPNSTGQPARIYSVGTGDLSNQHLVLSVRNLPPGTTARFVWSASQINPCETSGDGLRCVGRERTPLLPVLTANADGVVRWDVDFTLPHFDTINPGATRYVQVRYEDPAGGPLGFNWSESVKISFCQ